ncbi:hypothetical protein JRQ81_012147 [Phrynocephalus forsythii]|uniref:Uncharacterized protein n=1 Tax=Phrynocephalus forsythii TaxID=171643 RepID=A0A9Q0X5C4_9SAUR|nr:hypothetical protein JRQ81_012147 [Phrynocephalus forsythii]
MAAKQATVAPAELPFQTVQDLGPPLQIKMEDDDSEEGRGTQGPCIVQAGSLRDLSAWVGPEQVKEEPGGAGTQGWEDRCQEPPALTLPPALAWGTPQPTEAFGRRPRGVRKREQQVPAVSEETDLNPPESEHFVLGRRPHFHREAKQRTEREACSLEVDRRQNASRYFVE